MFLLLAIVLSTDFEGGSLAKVERTGEGHFRCSVKGEKDQDSRNRQASWYYFRVDGAKGKALTIDLTDLPGEYNYQPNRGAITADTLPFYSYDQRTWRVLENVEFDANLPRMRLHVEPEQDRMWIAHVPPYTGRDLEELLVRFRNAAALKIASAGKSAGGRDIPLLTITDPGVPDQDKKSIWLMFRQHAWEVGSSWSGEGAIRFLLSDDKTARRIRRETVFKILPLCDPDGVARGGVRFNSYGYDLNRNWDVSDPVKMPEIYAERKAILDWLDSGHHIDCLLTLHNSELPEYLEGPPDTTGELRPLMERIATRLAASPVWAPSRAAAFSKPTTTVGKPGRMTAPQGLYNDRKIPAFLVEQRIATHPKLGRQPNVEDRKRFGADLVQALWRSVTGE